MRASRQSGNGGTAYANSTVALDVDTGKLAWYYNHAPGESLDLDEVFERVLVDDGGQKLVFSAGKAGVLWKNDRKTGKYLGHKETVFQNIYDSYDPQTGEPHYRNDIVEQQVGPVDSKLSDIGRRPQLARDELSPGHQRVDHSCPRKLPGNECAEDRS